MGDIYSNAFLTIAADASDSVRGGCFNVLHCTITGTLPDGRKSKLTFHEVRGHTLGTILNPDMMKSSHLSKRAWCLQERLLSKRILHYTEEGLLWECREICHEPNCLTNLDATAVSDKWLELLQNAFSSDGLRAIASTGAPESRTKGSPENLVSRWDKNVAALHSTG